MKLNPIGAVIAALAVAVAGAPAFAQMGGEPLPAPAPLPPAADAPAPAAPATGGLSQEQIRELQTLLTQLGFDPGAVDGLVGPRTLGAVSAFEQSVGLPAAGALSPELLERLRTAAADAPAAGPADADAPAPMGDPLAP